MIYLWLTYKKIYLLKYYLKILFVQKKHEKCCILKIDGRVHHGGLCDRLKSAVIVYATCKANNIPFKLEFSSPFQLKDILIPHRYDWRITEEQLTKSIFNTTIITSYIGKLKFECTGKSQIHVYNFGGGYIDDVNHKYNTRYTFASIFQELFKPNEILGAQIEKLKNDIGGPYIAVTYRFQSLLGDFYEGKYFEKKGLTHSLCERENLIQQCVISLITIKDRHPNYPILVTSDSSTFLSVVNKIDNVIIIPGETVHMDFTKNAETKTYMKAFLDLYMLSGAEKIYRVSGLGLYETGFPKVAALMTNIEIEFIYL